MRDIILVERALREIVSERGWEWPEKAVLEIPKDERHGDLATNLALVISRQAGKAPRLAAEELCRALEAKLPGLLSAAIAGPGFINLTFAPSFWQEVILDAEREGRAFGSSHDGAGRRIVVEYVSANPTGPLHIGHGRGAAVGDSLTRLLRFAGYEVSTEYYINDAGRQMRLLGDSVYLRMRELCHLPVTYPEDPKGWYHGDYIRDIAREMLDRDPSLIQRPEDEAKNLCYEYACSTILAGIKEDLKEFRVEHQTWFSEKSLVDGGKVEAAFNVLRGMGLVYDKDDAVWLATGQFGDDKDRVLRKTDGYLTYFASDIAYHANKFERGFDECIDIWGADHHGYIPRMKAAITCMKHDPEKDFHVVLIQMVNLMRGGEPVAMSTRAGEFVTLREVLDEVGTDAARYMFLSRKSDSPLDFDLELVKQRNMDNPVYYVQYAHARVSALLRRAADRGIVLPERCSAGELACLTAPDDLSLLREAERFRNVVQDASRARAAHPVSFYLMELAGRLHSYYANNPILSGEDEGLMKARLALLRTVSVVIANGLELLGVSAPESM
ncbi:arginine--tRNA ligase [uncultured Mailhella sp.]|uniref:arginine--tRNA ligase n=1 Tax=uncultured Mailhella sp. TaxID=1981031 RepID=UPI00263A31F7|nr:arginine--tRNA ligase [uncultured Mailhella sp.]